jgi:hypothetical protein
MRTYRLIVMIALLTIVSGCYFGIAGRVIDVDTNQPIEGAVVLVEWTKTKGFPGMSHTESAKVAETLSDRDGKFDLPGCYDPFVNAPDVTIYKKGYVTWNNKYIFPAYNKRNDFQWRSNNLYKLDNFKSSYSYIDHASFTTGAINSTISAEKKQIFFKAYSAGEEEKVIQEQDERNKKRLRGVGR